MGRRFVVCTGQASHGKIVSWRNKRCVLSNGSPAPNKTSNSLTFGIPLKYPTSMKLYLTGKIGTSPPLKDVGFTNPSGRELIIWIVKFPIAFYNIIRLQRSALNLLLLICSTKVSSPFLSTHCTPSPPFANAVPKHLNLQKTNREETSSEVGRPNLFLWRPARNKQISMKLSFDGQSACSLIFRIHTNYPLTEEISAAQAFFNDLCLPVPMEN